MSDTIKNSYQFPLFDVVLYAKGHYKRTDSIWYDMALCLWKNGEGFGPYFDEENTKLTVQEQCFKQRESIATVIWGRIRKLLQPYRIDALFETMSPDYSWKCGYYTKNSPYFRVKENPEWEYWESMLRVHLSELHMMSSEELGYDNWDLFVINEKLKKDTE